MSSPLRGWFGGSQLRRTLYLYCATYSHIATSLAQVDSQTDVTAAAAEGMAAAGGVDSTPEDLRTALIASALKTSTKFPTGLIPSAPRTSSIIPSELPERFFPTGLIPSAPRSSTIISIEPSSAETPSPVEPTSTPGGASTPGHTALIPSAPVSPLPTISSPFPSFTIPTNGTIHTSATNVFPTFPSPTGMTSTQEGLHPIPAPSTNPGDPDGHHEIPEPNFSITLPCRGCSPVIEITATGWGTKPSFPINVPPAQEVETKASTTPAVTLSVGTSGVVVKPNPSGGDDFIIGDSTTVKPGQTVTVGGSPIAVHTSQGHTDLVIGGTRTVPLQPPTNSPIATVTAGGSPIVIQPAPSGNDFLIGDSTVHPGQTLTISNTPIAIQTSGSLTQVIVAGTQTIPLLPSAAQQITDAPVPLPITLPNGAILTPLPSPTQAFLIASQTLIAGGAPVVAAGTTYLLAPDATALVVNGQTTTLHPAFGSLYTTIAAAPLTLFGSVYTANRAGYYSLGPGTTLMPGGPALTVSGSVISLDAAGTAAVIQGSTSGMAPVTAVVTVVRSETGEARGTTAPTVRKDSGGVVYGGSVEGGGMMVLVLGLLVVGWLGVWR